MRVPLSDEEAGRLLRVVPFATGSEYINRAWLERVLVFTQFRELAEQALSGGERWLTELSDAELLSVLYLDGGGEL